MSTSNAYSCTEEGCTKIPSFNFKGMKRGIFCASHAKAGMENVKDKKCREMNCSKIPSFNYNESSKALFCATHKKDGMINVRSKKSRPKCSSPGCNKQPSFSFKGRPSFCQTHKTPGMINVKRHTARDRMAHNMNLLLQAAMYVEEPGCMA